MSSSTMPRDTATAPLLVRNPSRSGSLDGGVGLYNKTWRYGYFFAGCLGLLALETGLWRRFVAPLCGSFCDLNLFKESTYFKYASSGYDYAKMDNLQYPAGVLYFYQLISMLPSNTRQFIPMVLFAYFLFLSAYLMKRCRIPAGLMLFFVAPVGILLQGHALMFILPEMLGMTILLQTLTALVAGYQRSAVLLLVGVMSLYSIRVLPLIPAILLCLMRTMGARCAFLWIAAVFIGFALISGPYLLTNPAAYLIQCFALQPKSFNPFVWWVHFLENNFNLNMISRTKLEQLISSVLPGIFLRCSLQLLLINFRWLKSDGGILGLISKFMKSNRGHGIRPNPWTPRQTLTVIFEAMMVSVLLRFPSLVHAEEFELLTVMVSGFFCVALADPVPLPALFGIFSALSFPLSYLYRQFVSDVEGENVHFHLGLNETIHFLPMLILPISQLAVLLLFRRRDVGGVISQKSPTPSAASLSPLNSVAKGFAHHHRRSSSLSRRKID